MTTYVCVVCRKPTSHQVAVTVAGQEVYRFPACEEDCAQRMDLNVTAADGGTGTLPSATVRLTWAEVQP